MGQSSNPFVHKFLWTSLIAALLTFLTSCSNAIPSITSLTSKTKKSTQSQSPQVFVAETSGSAGGYKAHLTVTENSEGIYSAGSHKIETLGVTYE